MSVAVDSIASIAAARLSGFGLAVCAAPPPAGDRGWRRAADGPPLPAPCALPPAVGATWQLEKHAWFVAAAAVAALLVRGSMPPLGGVWLRYGADGWAEGIAVPRDGWSAAGGGLLAVRLEEHLAPVVDALSAHRPRRALWRSAGDRLGQAAIWCGEALGDRDGALSLAADALAAPTALRAPAGFGIVDGLPFRRRAGCCLSHRCDGGVECADCVLGR